MCYIAQKYKIMTLIMPFEGHNQEKRKIYGYNTDVLDWDLNTRQTQLKQLWRVGLGCRCKPHYLSQRDNSTRSDWDNDAGERNSEQRQIQRASKRFLQERTVLRELWGKQKIDALCCASALRSTIDVPPVELQSLDTQSHPFTDRTRARR